jgi:DNA-binding SARP family transcriptional activator
VLHALDRPGHEHLLTHYDADLGSHFWALGLAEGVAPERAMAALREIGNPEPVLPLLAHQNPTVRIHAAQALAAIGREEAMPALADALAAEGDQQATASLETALAHLESQPPPPLKVKLMGDFALWRGGQPVPVEAWQRPVVRRLFQYFALHRGEPLPRDRILDDLWPLSEPQKAWAAFRTSYSKLRPVLDPHLRPKRPSRYMAVQGEVYCFDPHGMAHVDTEVFEATVRRTLCAAEGQDMPPLPDELLAALESWEPLLPELPYEEWLLEARERLHSTYVEGCLYVAQTLLVYGRPGEAEGWARRTVQAAPWLEEGYQALMRAYARQGQRALALKTYAEAAEALRRELDVEPSSLTQWLAERLRQGEGI